jgi:hypothetical protein
MTTERVLIAVRTAIASHEGDEKELYQALCEEADTWEMRLHELENDDED